MYPPYVLHRTYGPPDVEYAGRLWQVTPRTRKTFEADAGDIRPPLSEGSAALLHTPRTSIARQTAALSDKMEKPFTARFINAEARVRLELTNTGDETCKAVEILAVFLKDEDTPGGGPSRAHIKFDPLKSVLPKEVVVMTHRTWIDGKPADADHDQLERLKAVAGEAKPYVLDISWENVEGKTRFQRIPVGH
jgi:hypothetical protein